ncbi:MAG TPA: hypothetical protein VHB20_03655 [Verrucomicrobiae bacterium]|jgi:hypothetical protein|nr:hypothetical protein [Verrucomicrobiae bacterium]
MNMESESPKNVARIAYVVVGSALASYVGFFVALAAFGKPSIGYGWTARSVVGLGALAACASIISMWLVSKWDGKRVLALGAASMVLSLAAFGWASHASNYALTAKSFGALRGANVPADLIADLKSAEGHFVDNEQQFLDGLDAQFGHDHIAPYRDALVRSGWNGRGRLSLAAMVTFFAAIGLLAGPLAFGFTASRPKFAAAALANESDPIRTSADS